MKIWLSFYSHCEIDVKKATNCNVLKISSSRLLGGSGSVIRERAQNLIALDHRMYFFSLTRKPGRYPPRDSLYLCLLLRWNVLQPALVAERSINVYFVCFRVIIRCNMFQVTAKTQELPARYVQTDIKIVV